MHEENDVHGGKTHGGSVWTADHTCGRREGVDESGEPRDDERVDNAGDHGFSSRISHQHISDSLDAASVSDVVTNTVVLSSGIQVNCTTTARRTTEIFVPLHHCSGFEFDFATVVGKPIAMEVWTIAEAWGYEDVIKAIQAALLMV